MQRLAGDGRVCHGGQHPGEHRHDGSRRTHVGDHAASAGDIVFDDDSDNRVADGDPDHEAVTCAALGAVS